MVLVYFNERCFGGGSLGLQFLLNLFENVYDGESCTIGTCFQESDILCEFEMPLNLEGSLVNAKRWRNTFLFDTGEKASKLNTQIYDVVLCREKNHKNVVNSSYFGPLLNRGIEKLEKTIEEIANDIKAVIKRENCPYKVVERIYCINNPTFEPERNELLKKMFLNLGVDDSRVKYISPTYKHTISDDTYNYFTKNQLVRHLRMKELTRGELSLFLNYFAVLEDIKNNYKEEECGPFLIFESDAMIGEDVEKFPAFLESIKTKNFDLIHLGNNKNDDRLFDTPMFSNFKTGYRMTDFQIDKNLLEYLKKTFILTGKIFIEDETTSSEEFRIVRKFYTRCTDSFLWSYKGIVKFLNYMKIFEDYSSPFDYYMCHCFETNLNIKHYWSAHQFFTQASNLNLIPSTLDRE